jgi:hypothetical protein
MKEDAHSRKQVLFQGLSEEEILALPARAGWAEASRRIAANGEDALVMPEFGNEEDDKLT